jgi:hypothetical protein
MANLREQELLLLTCIMAIMQKEELSDSRNRQAAETNGGQNEDQIWQRFGYYFCGELSSYSALHM